MKNGYIYALICPIKNNIVYIGQTTKSLEYRLKQHINETNKKVKNKKKLSKKCEWLKIIIEKKLEKDIIIEPIEYCEYEELDKKEVYYISLYDNLYNSNIGGNSNKGYSHTEETKELLRLIDKHFKIKTLEADYK